MPKAPARLRISNSNQLEGYEEGWKGAAVRVSTVCACRPLSSSVVPLDSNNHVKNVLRHLNSININCKGTRLRHRAEGKRQRPRP